MGLTPSNRPAKRARRCPWPAWSRFQRLERGLGQLMAGHKEALDDLPSHDVLLHDLGHVLLGACPVPDTFRVHDDAGPVLAVIQAAGLVRPDDPFEPQPFHFLLHELLQTDRSVVRAAPAGIALGTLLDAHKDVAFERGHLTLLTRCGGSRGTARGPRPPRVSRGSA